MPPDEIKGQKQLARKIAKARQGVVRELPRALKRAGFVVEGRVKRNVTGGGNSKKKLNVRSGRYRGSINTRLIRRNAVRVGTNVIYGPVHEYGATIRPKNAKVLRFMIDGKVIFARKVVIPARPHFRPALKTERKRVVKIIRQVYAGPLGISGV